MPRERHNFNRILPAAVFNTHAVPVVALICFAVRLVGPTKFSCVAASLQSEKTGDVESDRLDQFICRKDQGPEISNPNSSLWWEAHNNCDDFATGHVSLAA